MRSTSFRAYPRARNGRGARLLLANHNLRSLYHRPLNIYVRRAFVSRNCVGDNRASIVRCCSIERKSQRAASNRSLITDERGDQMLHSIERILSLTIIAKDNCNQIAHACTYAYRIYNNFYPLRAGVIRANEKSCDIHILNLLKINGRTGLNFNFHRWNLFDVILILSTFVL